MDNSLVDGRGTSYATEALIASGVESPCDAGRISRARYDVLAEDIIMVKARAIDSGGTTLRDFIGGDGKPGYFQQELFVYGRAGQLCKLCGTTLSECRLGQRSSVFCRHCQS